MLDSGIVGGQAPGATGGCGEVTARSTNGVSPLPLWSPVQTATIRDL